MKIFLKSLSRGIHILLGTCNYLFKRAGIEKEKWGKQGKKCFHLKGSVPEYHFMKLSYAELSQRSRVFMQPSRDLPLPPEGTVRPERHQASVYLHSGLRATKGANKYLFLSVQMKRKRVEKAAALPYNHQIQAWSKLNSSVSFSRKRCLTSFAEGGRELKPCKPGKQTFWC